MASQLPNDLKDYLKSIEARLHQFQTECIQTGKPFTMDAIKSFIKAGYTSQGITFQTLVDEFLKSLRLKLKSVFLFGLRNELTRNNPFTGYKIGRKYREVRFLTEEEVQRIENKEIPNECLERVKDLFLFQCFTSISFVDMALLEPNDFHSNEEGTLYLRKNRKKTGVEFFIVLGQTAFRL